MSKEQTHSKTNRQKRHEFAIFSAKGEVRALYRDWKCKVNSKDIMSFEYEIAEVLYIDDVGVEVLPLQTR